MRWSRASRKWREQVAGNLSVHDLEDADFQRREWLVERFAWVAIAVFLLAALLGAFSGGPLSQATSAAADGSVEVEYQRFVRSMGKAELTIFVGADAVRGDAATVYVSNDLIDEIHVDNIQPEPESVISRRDGVVYEFAAQADSPPIVVITYRSTSVGLTRGVVRAGPAGPDEGDGASLWQLTYP